MAVRETCLMIHQMNSVSGYPVSVSYWLVLESAVPIFAGLNLTDPEPEQGAPNYQLTAKYLPSRIARPY